MKRIGSKLFSLLLAAVMALSPALSVPALAADHGPGNVSGPISVTEPSTIVGSTTISVAGSDKAVNVTGGSLAVNTAAGSSPGPITIASVNGNALEAAGGTIMVQNPGLTVNTVGGHSVLSNGSSSNVTISEGADLSTSGVGTAMVAIGGAIDATGVVVNNTGTAGVGHGAVAESGGQISLRDGTSIVTNAFNSVGLGASGTGSKITANVLIPVTMNGKGSMGVYLLNGGEVSLLPGSILTLNGNSSMGLVADNSTVTTSMIGTGLTVNLDGSASEYAGTGVAAFNGGEITLDGLEVKGTSVGFGAIAHVAGKVALTDADISISGIIHPTFYKAAFSYLVTQNGQDSSTFNSTATSFSAGLAASGGTVESTDGEIRVNAGSVSGAAGAFATLNGTVTLTGDIINAVATDTFGIRADGFGTVSGDGVQVTASGGGAALTHNSAPASITLENSTVRALGDLTEGLTALNTSSGDKNTLSLTNTTLSSEKSAAIAVQGPLEATLNNATVSGESLLDVVNNPSGPLLQPTVLTVNASGGSLLSGDAVVQDASSAQLDLKASSWTGAATGDLSVKLDSGSSWDVSGDTQMTKLTAAGRLLLGGDLSATGDISLTGGKVEVAVSHSGGALQAPKLTAANMFISGTTLQVDISGIAANSLAAGQSLSIPLIKASSLSGEFAGVTGGNSSLKLTQKVENNTLILTITRPRSESSSSDPVERTEPEELDPQPWKNPFSDVLETDWFYDDMKYVCENGLMYGIGNGLFSPNGTTSRGMLVTVLWRLAGKETVNSEQLTMNRFSDVKAGMYYTDAVLWASENGVVLGYDELTFGPEDMITREQLLTMLWRYAMWAGLDVSASADLSGFPDADKVSDWALPAMRWAVAEGIIRGRNDGGIDPGGYATRAELAAVLHRFLAQ